MALVLKTPLLNMLTYRVCSILFLYHIGFWTGVSSVLSIIYLTWVSVIMLCNTIAII